MRHSISSYSAAHAAVLILVSAGTIAAQTQSADSGTFKVAYYNIQSGMGATQLTGTCSFVRNSNCTDPSKPMNAWGVGVVQDELTRAIGRDPGVIALGLSEAWTCATPGAVLRALGWAAHTGERNGVSLLARYGFAGPAEWFQLDTSLNPNPADTMWVVRAPVCADATCSRSVEIFSAHWYATGETRTESYERQARETAAFMDRLPATEPRVLVGDLNVWAEGGLVCNQTPVPTAVQILSNAGNVDAWPAVHGTAEGYTGMWNRNGCGEPNGYLWKRIDHAWAKGLQNPVSMTRFGMVTPGACAPSDHAGIIVEYGWPGSGTFDFSLSASPSAKKVRPGGRTSYGVTVSGGSATPVALSVSGLPEGATASFNPASITGSGTSTLTIQTSQTTAAGIYTLTITGTGGGVTRSVGVSMEVLKRR